MFWRKTADPASVIRYDVHTHLLPGVDDGVADLEAACDAIAVLRTTGYAGAVVTPHIWSERFDNSESELQELFDTFRQEVAQRAESFELSLGAEYMFDEVFLSRLYDSPDALLRFGPNRMLLLVELPPGTMPLGVNELLDECARLDLRPILAHIERYSYVQGDPDFDVVRDWRQRGALTQVNVGSVAGQYGSDTRRCARGLVKAGIVDLFGSDLHRPGLARKVMPDAWTYLRRKIQRFAPTWHHQLMG